MLRFFKPGSRDHHTLWLTRAAVLVLGLAALVLALHKTSVYDLIVDSWSVLLATLFVPLTAGIWWSRGNGPGALAAIIVGFISWQVLLVVTPNLPADLLAVPFAALALILVSLATRQRTPALPLTNQAGESLAYADRLGLSFAPHPKADRTP